MPRFDSNQMFRDSVTDEENPSVKGRFAEA